MWPVIVSVGPLTLYSFGVFLMLAVVLGLFVSWKKIREYHIEDQDFFDVALQVIFWGLVGSRLLYIAEHFSFFGLNFLKWLWFTHYVGLSLWGAFLGGILIMWWLNKETKRDLFEWLDITALGLALGISVGRIASLLNGSEIGIKNLPIQLLEVVGMFVLFVVLWNLEKSYRTIEWYRAGKSSAKAGFLWFMLLIVTGVIFFTTSFLYQNANIMTHIWPLSSLVIGVVGIYWRSGRNLRQDFKIKLPKKR